MPHSESERPSRNYHIQVGRDGQLWRAVIHDRYGRTHQVTEEPYALGTLLHLASQEILRMEQP